MLHESDRKTLAFSLLAGICLACKEESQSDSKHHHVTLSIKTCNSPQLLLFQLFQLMEFNLSLFF